MTDAAATLPFRTGFRLGCGKALAVVLPRSLVELWRVIQVCTDAGIIIIMQAANTGLTGGSAPDDAGYDRDIVIINVMAISRIHVIEGGRQVVCLPGATLYELEAALKPFGREPHSVIGSSCIGASVIGGVCNNSGGALVRRGPAYTEMALFARVTPNGELRLINHLGIQLDGDPEHILKQVEDGKFETNNTTQENRRAHRNDYIDLVRDIESDTPARFNADPRGLFEASGCAGKVVVLAVRLDTFPKDERTQVFYVGTNDPRELTKIRKHILSKFNSVPVAGEYMDGETFDLAEIYGKDIYLAIRYLGTRRIPRLFMMKARLDRVAMRLGFRAESFSDHIMHRLARILPNHLPPRIRKFRSLFKHHLIIRMADSGIEEATSYLSSIFPSSSGNYFACDPREGESAFLHRFVAASAAVRYRTVHSNDIESILALDVALRRNDTDWYKQPPEDVSDRVLHTLNYGHFFCHVFHHDYLLKKGASPEKIERRLCELMDERGAEYPAEHNVGHHYYAKTSLSRFYQDLDPSNILNPGIGRTSKRAFWN